MIARLEHALTRQRELTQNASHELRTPLTVLTAEIEVALQHHLDPAPRESVSTALDEARRVGRLADDLLTLAHVEEGHLPVATEALDLDELVRAAAARAARDQRADGRTIAVDSETLIAQADPVRIEQAVTNLLDNALIHGQGTVTVTLRHDGERILLTVDDEGPGFASSLQATAFDRFARAPGRPRRGAGLGLAIVKAVAEAHGGPRRPSSGSRRRSRDHPAPAMTAAPAAPADETPPSGPVSALPRVRVSRRTRGSRSSDGSTPPRRAGRCA